MHSIRLEAVVPRLGLLVGSGLHHVLDIGCKEDVPNFSSAENTFDEALAV